MKRRKNRDEYEWSRFLGDEDGIASIVGAGLFTLNPLGNGDWTLTVGDVEYDIRATGKRKIKVMLVKNN